MLEKRITRLEGLAPPPRKQARSEAAVMLDRVATLKGRSDLTTDEQRELDQLWTVLTEAAKC